MNSGDMHHQQQQQQQQQCWGARWAWHCGIIQRAT
jgi:hypothetical protein